VATTPREDELIQAIRALLFAHKGCIGSSSDKPHYGYNGPCEYCTALHLVKRIEREEEQLEAAS
jgi:hypothetical protein